MNMLVNCCCWVSCCLFVVCWLWFVLYSVSSSRRVIGVVLFCWLLMLMKLYCCLKCRFFWWFFCWMFVFILVCVILLFGCSGISCSWVVSGWFIWILVILRGNCRFGVLWKWLWWVSIVCCWLVCLVLVSWCWWFVFLGFCCWWCRMKCWNLLWCNFWVVVLILYVGGSGFIGFCIILFLLWYWLVVVVCLGWVKFCWYIMGFCFWMRLLNIFVVCWMCCVSWWSLVILWFCGWCGRCNFWYDFSWLWLWIFVCVDSMVIVRVVVVVCWNWLSVIRCVCLVCCWIVLICNCMLMFWVLLNWLFSSWVKLVLLLWNGLCVFLNDSVSVRVNLIVSWGVVKLIGIVSMMWWWFNCCKLLCCGWIGWCGFIIGCWNWCVLLLIWWSLMWFYRCMWLR